MCEYFEVNNNSLYDSLINISETQKKYCPQFNVIKINIPKFLIPDSVQIANYPNSYAFENMPILRNLIHQYESHPFVYTTHFNHKGVICSCEMHFRKFKSTTFIEEQMKLLLSQSIDIIETIPTESIQNNTNPQEIMLFPPNSSIHSKLRKEVKKFSIQEIPTTKKACESECSICFNQFSKKHIQRILPCGHFFHKGCIDKWIMKKDTCPLCRDNPFKSNSI